MGTVFPLFLVGTSPDCQEFSNMMVNGLANSSASSLKTYKCISSGPMDLCTFRFLKLLKPNLPLQWVVLYSTSRFVFCDLAVWLEYLPVKSEAKVIDYLSLHHILSSSQFVHRNLYTNIMKGHSSKFQNPVQN